MDCNGKETEGGVDKRLVKGGKRIDGDGVIQNDWGGIFIRRSVLVCRVPCGCLPRIMRLGVKPSALVASAV